MKNVKWTNHHKNCEVE